MLWSWQLHCSVPHILISPLDLSIFSFFAFIKLLVQISFPNFKQEKRRMKPFNTANVYFENCRGATLLEHLRVLESIHNTTLFYVFSFSIFFISLSSSFIFLFYFLIREPLKKSKKSSAISEILHVVKLAN